MVIVQNTDWGNCNVLSICISCTWLMVLLMPIRAHLFSYRWSLCGTMWLTLQAPRVGEDRLQNQLNDSDLISHVQLVTVQAVEVSFFFTPRPLPTKVLTYITFSSQI